MSKLVRWWWWLLAMLPLLVSASCSGKMDFTLSQSSLNIQKGGASQSISLSFTKDAGALVSLSANSVPTGVTVSFDPSSVSGSSSIVTVSASTTATVGQTSFEVVGVVAGVAPVRKTVNLNIAEAAQVQLFDSTEVADAATRTALNSYDANTGAMAFSQSTPVLEKVQVGDVIVSEPSPNAPFGYLRKVTAVQKSAAGMTLETEQATLNQAIQKAEINFDVPLEPSKLKKATPAMPGVRLVHNKNGVCIGYCYEAFVDAELCFSANCGAANIKINGTVKFAMGLNINSKWSCCIPPMDLLEVSFGASEQAKLKITGTLQGQLNKRIKIATYDFSTITFFIGPVPVVIVPSISIYVGVDGDVSVNFEYGVRQSIGARVGVRWEHEKGWSPIKEFTPNLEQDPPPTIRGAAKIFAYAEVVPKLSLYGVGDIEASIKAGPELEAGFPRKPLWNLRARLMGMFRIGVTIPIFDKELKHEEELFNLVYDLTQASNEAPIITSIPSNSSREPGAYSVFLNTSPDLFGGNGVVAASDAEDGSHVTLSANSNIDGDFTAISGGVSKNLSVGIHTIRVKVTDTNGATTDGGTYLLNVRLTQPDLTLNPSGTTVQQAVGFPASAGASQLDQSKGVVVSLPCTNIGWTVSAPDVVRGSSGNEAQSLTGCDMTIRFLAQGTRTVSVSATGLTGGVTTQSFTVNVTAPPPVLPPLVDAIVLFCNNTPSATCSTTGVARALVNATDPEGRPLTYTWTVEPRYNNPAERVSLQEEFSTPPAGYTSQVIAPKKVGVMQINPSWVFAGDKVGGKFSVTVSNGETSTTRTAEMVGIVPPK